VSLWGRGDRARKSRRRKGGWKLEREGKSGPRSILKIGAYALEVITGY